MVVAAPAACRLKRPPSGDDRAGGHRLVDDLAIDAAEPADSLEVDVTTGHRPLVQAVPRHDLVPGGEIGYVMTGPDGEKSYGWWRVTAVDPPRSLEFTEGFANEDGTPNEETPSSTVQVSLDEADRGTRMELRFLFESREQMEELETFGMFEGIPQSVGQMDALLASR